VGVGWPPGQVDSHGWQRAPGAAQRSALPAGLGWPGEREESLAGQSSDGARVAAVPSRPDVDDVSRETSRLGGTDPEGPASGATRAGARSDQEPAVGSRPAGARGQTGGRPAEPSVGGKSEDTGGGARRRLSRSRDAPLRPRLIPRHALIRRPSRQSGGRSLEQLDPLAFGEPAAEEKDVWPPPFEAPIPAAGTSQGSRGHMIAGTYPGALSAAPRESEDEVAIPEPDTSADTPIARAAQAAMKARAG